ncbi:MAG TPA: hypothetical protein VFV99_15315 [Kofleriaceae bacterium]|nr:hypothetical protein [Kofleriaceae bacterium]
MRTVCLVVLLLAACKDKQEAKPTPAPTPALAQVVPEKTEAPPPEAPRPAAPAAVKPAGGLNTQAEYEAKAFELTDKLAEVFAAAGTNCPKLADNIERFAAANQQAFAGTEEFEQANPTAEDELEPKLREKSTGLMQKISLSMQACQKDERVKAALAKLPK